MTLRQKISDIPLYLQILIGMITGIIIGLIALQVDGGDTFIRHWIQPWGQIFIRLLQLIAIPLVFISLIKGMTGLKDISKFSRIGGKTIGIYICTTVVAILIGLAMGLLVQPGKLVNHEQVAHLQEHYHTVAEEKKIAAEQNREQGPLAFLTDIVPNNIIKAASDNGKMLQIIFFAVLFGLATLALPSQKVQPVIALFDSLNDIILKMVDYIILFAPWGGSGIDVGIGYRFPGRHQYIQRFGCLCTDSCRCLVYTVAGFLSRTDTLLFTHKSKEVHSCYVPRTTVCLHNK